MVQAPVDFFNYQSVTSGFSVPVDNGLPHGAINLLSGNPQFPGLPRSGEVDLVKFEFWFQ